MKVKLTFTILFLFVIQFSFGQTQIQKELYQAFLNNDVTKWKNTTFNYEKKADLNKTADLLQLIHCYYGYVSALIDKKQYKSANENIKKGESYIEKVLKTNPDNAPALNYKGVFLSYYIAMNKMKAAILGKQSVGFINKAYNLDPDNVQILFDKGNSLYYPPKMFGGDKKEALTYFQKAIAIIEQQKDTRQNWLYVQTLFLAARCYELQGNIDLAKKGYEKALNVEPNFKLVRDKYYPELLRKL